MQLKHCDTDTQAPLQFVSLALVGSATPCLQKKGAAVAMFARVFYPNGEAITREVWLANSLLRLPVGDLDEWTNVA